MKWDIDRAIRNILCKTAEPHISVQCEFLNTNRLVQVGLSSREPGMALVWILTFGKTHGPQKAFYGFSIREAFVRAMKWLKAAGPAELEKLGATKPKKRSHYLRVKHPKRLGQATV